MKVLFKSNLVLLIGLLIFILGVVTIAFFKDLTSILYNLFENSFLLSVFASFLSALFLALIIFVLFRPRVAISPYISNRVDEKTDVEYYSFKFINTSIFSAFDVNIEAYVCYEISATNNGRGMNVRTKKVDLRRSQWIYMANWRYVSDDSIYAPHCMIVSTKLEIEDKDNYVDNIKKEIESNANYLEFRVTLKHSFSNLSSTYRKRFNTSDCVKFGKFKFGNSLEIV